jgi:muramoyltetrapeptide carboxypeptidase
MNKKWQHLEPGDIVDIIAPAAKPTEKQIEDSKAYIISLGLIPRIPENIKSEDSYYFANSKEERFKQLKDALYAHDSKAIWPVRGGYGSAHLIEDLEALTPPAQAKLFIGFSDITVPHIFLTQKWFWSTIHGNVLFYMALNKDHPERNQQTEDVIFGRVEKVEFANLIPLNDLARQTNYITNTTVTGGNLCLLDNSLGTDWQFDADGKILLLEDVKEDGYGIHRMLTHLKQAHVLDNVKAIIFGDMSAELEGDQIQDCHKFIDMFIAEQNVPVLSYNAIGHNHVTNPAVPLGTPCSLMLGESGRLSCETGAEFFTDQII